MALPVLAGALMAGGLIGGLSGANKSRKAYKSAMGTLGQVGSMIEQQYANVDQYFNQAGQDLAAQYQPYYTSQIEQSINQLANQGIYESPVSERALGRTRSALAQTYASARSELAGQRMQAMSSIDAQKINYLQNLAQLQYSKQMAKQQQQTQLFGTIGGLGSSLLGMKST